MSNDECKKNLNSEESVKSGIPDFLIEQQLPKDFTKEQACMEDKEKITSCQVWLIYFLYIYILGLLFARDLVG